MIEYASKYLKFVGIGLDLIVKKNIIMQFEKYVFALKT